MDSHSLLRRRPAGCKVHRGLELLLIKDFHMAHTACHYLVA